LCFTYAVPEIRDNLIDVVVHSWSRVSLEKDVVLKWTLTLLKLSTSTVF
jgi:hypothetical protein